jgi:hypothetical protein
VIPREFLKQIFIGVGLDSSTERTLRGISQKANGDFFTIGNNGIEEIF